MVDTKPSPYPQQYPSSNPPPGYVSGGAPSVTIHVAQRMGEQPCDVECPSCHAHVVTEIRYENGLLVWIIFAACFGFGFILLVPWCLCWIPFCIDACKDVDHYCPNCKHLVGKFKRIG